ETLGYWYPLYKTPFISAFNMVFQNDCGLKSANLVPPFSKILGKFVYACFDGKIGAAFILFSMGAFVFSSLYLLIVYIKHRGYKAAAPFLPAFLVWLSVMISSPIADHLRYLDCFFCVIPLFIALALVKKNDKKVD
ncbi:MAG: hypothetical protein IJL87_01595, partial [Clostridia bacterium]|nr:hypothetical protein [Clostridia bacterium]